MKTINKGILTHARLQILVALAQEEQLTGNQLSVLVGLMKADPVVKNVIEVYS